MFVNFVAFRFTYTTASITLGSTKVVHTVSMFLLLSVFDNISVVTLPQRSLLIVLENTRVSIRVHFVPGDNAQTVVLPTLAVLEINRGNSIGLVFRGRLQRCVCVFL
ncbi:hypothetical protein GN244_ATG08796 [Phytophthora infestans]|uniref:Uncharacterized protein n=1 Tax=Phytophthora infestans TaxID=4787 RepID=A0A833W1Y0_PHYIN|nr:hypothetical protein GN244_ATG08796 [Phytophthora infestans]KAF4148652.1 hypothetical protein GN958_ATG02132 [Phytophthora infestans]